MLAGLTLAGLTTQANAAPPGIPTELKVTSNADGSATLSWTAPSGGPTDYDYQYRQHPGGTWTEYDADKTSTALTKTITGLTNNKTYRFRVRAGNNDGDGKWTGNPPSVPHPEVKIWPLEQPSKPEVIPFVVPNAGTYNTYSLVKWTLAGRNPKHGYEINTMGGPADNGYATDATEGQFMRAAPATNLLKKGLTYQIRLRGEDGPNGPNGPWSKATSVKAESATVAHSNVTSNGATLTVSNLPAQWWYKGDQSGAQCTAVANGTTTASLTGLDSGTKYTYNIYYRSTCTEDSAKAAHWDVKATFTTQAATAPPAPSKPTVGGGDAQVTLSAASVTNTGGSPITKWQYAYKSKPSGGSYSNYGSWKDVTGTSTTMPNTTVSNLTNGTEYTFKVRAVNSNGDGADSPESDAVTPAVTATLTTPANASQSVTAGAGDAKLTASNVTHNAATLIIGNHNGDWYYKTTAPTIGICSASAVNTLSVDLADLAGNTSYTFKAYSNSGCTTELAAAAAFLTKPAKPAKPTVTAGDGNGTLTLASSVTGGTGALSNWEYSTDDGTTWTTINVTSTTLSYVVTGLTDGTDYTFKVRATNTTGAGPTSDASDPATPRGKATLTVSSVTHHSATLTIGNHTGDWYYKATTPTSGVCSATAVTTASLDLADLAGNTSYTFTAYSNSTCATELATASAFLTKPAKPSKPTVTAGAGRDTLTLSASVTGDGTLTKWQYTHGRRRQLVRYQRHRHHAQPHGHRPHRLDGLHLQGAGRERHRHRSRLRRFRSSHVQRCGFPQAGRRDPPQGGWSSHCRHHHGNHDATGCNCSRSSSQQPAPGRGHRFPAVLAEPGTGVESRASAMGGSPLRSQLRSSPPPSRLVLGRRCSRH